jgi:hypothetical protein
MLRRVIEIVVIDDEIAAPPQILPVSNKCESAQYSVAWGITGR